MLTPIPAGPVCAAGGTRVDVGIDANDNGKLDPGEVEQTANLCNGTPGDTGTPGAGGTQAGGSGGATGGVPDSGGAPTSGGSGGVAADAGEATVTFELTFNGTFRFGNYSEQVGTDPATGLPVYVPVGLQPGPSNCTPALTTADIRTCTWTLPASNGGVNFGLWPPGMTYELDGPLPDACQFSIDDTGTPLFSCGLLVTGNPTRFSLTFSVGGATGSGGAPGTGGAGGASGADGGACPTTCANCQGGRCIVVLGTDNRTTVGVAVDDASVYWTSESQVLKVPLQGGLITTLATGQEPYDVVADAQNVYFTTYSGGTIMRVPRDGGTAVPLATNQVTPKGIAVDASNVYWRDAAAISKVSIAGGTPVAIASSGGTGEIAIDAANVYWVTGNGTAQKAPLAGGATVTLGTSNESGAWGVAVDTANVYWSNNQRGTLSKVSVAGGTVSVLATGLDTPRGIAIDNGYVYVTSQYGNMGLVKVDVRTGATTVVDPTFENSWSVAVDATTAYYTSFARVVSATPK